MTRPERIGPERIGIAWEAGLSSGWGTYGLNLCLQLARRDILPVPFKLASDLPLGPLQHRLLRRALKEAVMQERFFAVQGRIACDGPVLISLGDGLEQGAYFKDRIDCPAEIAVTFFESAVLPAENVARVGNLPLLVTGSRYNQTIAEMHGLSNAVYCPQGIEPSLFHPGPAPDWLGDRFVVFSGGKFEYRKGQDIVTRAFRRFAATHPDAILLTAWHNIWQASLDTLADSPLIEGVPAIRPDGSLDVTGFLERNGVPRAQSLDLGRLPNDRFPPILRAANVAVFPNRCEGGTNLVAMEAMACGTPAILSKNTGHLDLIAEDACYVLEKQTDIGALSGNPARAGWGESLVDEVVECLERAYADRAEARQRGARAARFMQDWSWSAQTDRLLAAIAASGWEPASRL